MQSNRFITAIFIGLFASSASADYLQCLNADGSEFTERTIKLLNTQTYGNVSARLECLGAPAGAPIKMHLTQTCPGEESPKPIEAEDPEYGFRYCYFQSVTASADGKVTVEHIAYGSGGCDREATQTIDIPSCQ